FARYVNILRLIGCNDPKRRWLLKNPGTIGQLDSLFEHFPDACVVQMHRHPLKAVPSISSTLYYIHLAFEGEAGAEASAPIMGPREMEKWIGMIEHGEKVRKTREGQFIDIYHKDLHANPMKEIQKIYDRFGLKMSAEAEKLIRARMHENPE